MKECNLDAQKCVMKIRNLLNERKDVKLGDLEKAAGHKPGYLWRLEKQGRSVPSTQFLSACAHAFGMTVDALLDIDIMDISFQMYQLDSLLPCLFTTIRLDILEFIDKGVFGYRVNESKNIPGRIVSVRDGSSQCSGSGIILTRERLCLDESGNYYPSTLLCIGKATIREYIDMDEKSLYEIADEKWSQNGIYQTIQLGEKSVSTRSVSSEEAYRFAENNGMKFKTGDTSLFGLELRAHRGLLEFRGRDGSKCTLYPERDKALFV